MDSLPRKLRIGVVDFVQAHLPFALRIEEKLYGSAEFAYFFSDPPEDTRDLLEGREWRDWQPHTASPTVSLDDRELLEACGRHELMRASCLPAMLRRARALVNRLDCFISETRVECLLVWNGQRGLGGALATWLACRRGLQLVFFENGPLPGTMQLDRCGVNYYSEHTARIAAGEYRHCVIDEERLERCLNLLRTGRRPADFIPARPPETLPAQELARELLHLFRPAAWRNFSAQLPVGLRHYVLLPMQVVDDSQLSTHSPLLGHDLERLVMEVYLAMREALPQHRLVVKIHPKETADASNRYLRLAARLPDVYFVKSQPMHELLAGCELVVTVNSTVGVEALAFGKPVITLGHSFYTVPDLVRPVDRLELLPQAMRTALHHPPPPRRVRQFLGYLQQHMCAEGNAADLSERSLNAVATRLLELARPPALAVGHGPAAPGVVRAGRAAAAPASRSRVPETDNA